MPTIITTRATKENTIIVTAAFTDENGDAVTPNAGLKWTLTDMQESVLNSRLDVALTPATSVDIVLTNADLAALGSVDDGRRRILIEGDYDSSAGLGLSLDQDAVFVIETQIPVSLQDAKLHMRVLIDTDDFLITALISAATGMAEDFTHRKLITQTIIEYFRGWPPSTFELKFGNLQSVTTLKYTDFEESQSTFDASKYLVDTTRSDLVGRVLLGFNETWPSDTLSAKSPIEITYVCGYGATGAHVPARIRHAIMIMVADMYENRESIVIGTITSQRDSVQSLLYPFRLGVF